MGMGGDGFVGAFPSAEITLSSVEQPGFARVALKTARDAVCLYHEGYAG